MVWSIVGNRLHPQLVVLIPALASVERSAVFLIACRLLLECTVGHETGRRWWFVAAGFLLLFLAEREATWDQYSQECENTEGDTDSDANLRALTKSRVAGGRTVRI
jgi:hypothetical protein